MEQVIFYQLITPDKVKALNELLMRWVNYDVLSGWFEHMLEKVCVGSYLIISTSVEKATVYAQPDPINIIKLVDKQPKSIDNIRLMSIWRNKPNTYSGMHSVITFTGIPNYAGPVKELKTIIQELQSIFLNTQQNGKGKDRLQEERTAGAGFSEGRVLYGGRDIPEYSAGRHCNQARAQESPAGNSRPQIFLSSRCPEILGA